MSFLLYFYCEIRYSLMRLLVQYLVKQAFKVFQRASGVLVCDICDKAF